MKKTLSPMLVSFCLALIIPRNASADDDHDSVPSPELEQILADDFQTDTRPKYEINGNASWEKGSLTLATGCRVTRKIKSGSHVEVNLGLKFATLENDGDQSVTLLQFDFDEATPCLVGWYLTRIDEKVACRVRILDSVLKGGKLKYVLVEERELVGWPRAGDWRISYRYGLLGVRADKSQQLAGYVDNGWDSVTSVQIFQGAHRTDLSRLLIVADPRRPELSDAQQKEVVHAKELNARGAKLYSEGKTSEAISVIRSAIDIDIRILGDRHPNYAQDANNLAHLYQSTGDYANAKVLMSKARDLRKKVLGDQHPLYLDSLNSLAHLYRLSGEYAKAKPLMLEALGVIKRSFGDQHPSYATSLHNLADLYQLTGEHVKAETLYIESRDLIKKVLGGQHPNYATSLDNLGLLYMRMAEYGKSEPLLLEARDLRKQVFGDRHPDYATSLNNVASLYKQMGDYGRAETLMLKVRDLGRKAFGDQHPSYASSLHNLAGVYMSTGDYAKAKPLMLEARDLLKESLGDSHPSYASSLCNLATLHELTGDYSSAEMLFLEARDVTKEVLGDKHPSYATDLDNLAGVYKSMGEYAKAERMYLEARNLTKATLGNKHPSYASRLNNLAELYHSKGDYAKAEPLLLEARKLQEIALGAEHPEYAIKLHNLAALYASMGEYEKSRSYSISGVRLEQRNDQKLLLIGSEAQGLNYLGSQPLDVDLLLSICLYLDEDQEELYQLIWQRRRLLYRTTSLRNRQFHLMQTLANVQTRQDYQDYQRTRNRIGQLILASAETDPQKAQVRQTQIAKLSDDKERLEKSLAAVVPQFGRELDDQPASELQKRLPSGAVLIDVIRYTRFEQDEKVPGKKGERRTRSYAAFVIHRDEPIARIELGAAQPIDDAVHAWRKAIAEGLPEKKPADELSRLVWKPMAPTLPDAVKTIYLCPDPSLDTTPWPALPTGGDRVLLEDYAVALVPHGQYLLRQLSREPATEPKENLLVVGDVSYDREPSLTTEPLQLGARTRDAALGDKRIEWPYLPGSKREMEEVARLADQREVTQLRGNAATTAQLLAALPKSRFAHLATHGFFADPKFRSYLQVREEVFEKDRGLSRIGDRSTVVGRNPLVLSGLVFAGANLPRKKDEYGVPTDGGGILTAEAIAGLPLYDLKLAVLSACDTGLGDKAGGEGVYGLQRAFHTAGAENVVASLWKVSDDGTAALMRLFYYKLWTEGKPPLQALRESQLHLYYHPNEIKDLASSRGPDFAKTVKRVNQDVREGDRANTKIWASFVLSGVGR